MQDSVPPLPTEWVQPVTSLKTHRGRQGNSCIVPVSLARAREYLSSRAFLTDKAQGIGIQPDFVRPGWVYSWQVMIALWKQARYVWSHWASSIHTFPYGFTHRFIYRSTEECVYIPVWTCTDGQMFSTETIYVVHQSSGTVTLGILQGSSISSAGKASRVYGKRLSTSD